MEIKARHPNQIKDCMHAFVDYPDMNLPKITLLYGALLIPVGLGGYLLSDRESLTALIPAASNRSWSLSCFRVVWNRPPISV